MSQIQLPLSSKRSTYLLLLGVTSCTLAAGLAVPIAVGERVVHPAAGAGNARLDLSQLDDAPTLDGDATTGEAGSTVPGAATGRAATPGVGTSARPATTGSTVAPVSAAPGTLTASDVGVTAETIKVGLLIPNSEAVGDPKAQESVQRQEFQVFLDEINERGGIHGRRVEAVVATYDVLDQEEGTRAACLALARDEKVFAAFNTTGFGPPGALCLTRAHGVPFLQGSGHPDEVYRESGLLYSSSFDSQTRNLRNMVWFLNQLGVLAGKKVGVLGSDWIGLRREQEEGIVQTLESLGYDPFVYWLSGDPASSQAQVPVAVQQMRQEDVEVVIFGADFVSGTSFVQQANSQLYSPRYAAADPWSWSTDFTVSGMPDSFAGAITITAMRTYDARVDVPEPAVDAACREVYERRSGNDLDRANDTNALYIGTMWACGVVQRFEQAALLAGPELTRAGLASAVTRLGTMPVPYSGGPGTFGPEKLDGANHYRPQEWHADCHCWVPLVGEFVPGHYS